MDAHPPERVPVLRVVLYEQCAARVGAKVPHALQVGRALLLDRVDWNQDPRAVQREHHRHDVDAADRVHRGEHAMSF